MAAKAYHSCPICSRRVRHRERYPNEVCETCYGKAGDADGRQLSFSNTSIGGGFKAVFTDTQAEYPSHICYIEGIECWADEARFGGIVIEAQSVEEIKFYHVDKPYGFFSNFAPYAIYLKDKIWPTSEHYFQAQKFVGTPHEEEIRQAPTPMAAAQLGRDRTRPLRPDWEVVKDDIMREALYAKFTQHPDLTEHLLATGHAKLVEHTRNDSYWGDGGNGSGRNMLGKLLVETRERIAQERSVTSPS